MIGRPSRPTLMSQALGALAPSLSGDGGARVGERTAGSFHRGGARGSGAAPASSGGARQRLYIALRRGATTSAAAVQAGVSLGLAEVMIEEMKRQGLLDRAESLCSSGLGACGGGDSDEVRIHCAGCPILPLKI